jgi:thioredoxin reductase (NADPH)
MSQTKHKVFSFNIMEKNRAEKQFDVLIVGAGPIGMTCGIEAKRRGMDYLIIEKGALVNSVFRFPTNMTFFSTSNVLEIGDVPFIAHGDKPTRREALEYFRRVHEKWALNIHFYENVEEINKSENGHFAVRTNKSLYTSANVILATGFYDRPRMMNIPGEELSKVKHFYDEPHPYVGQKVVVVGAANSACDVALELYYKGAEVTMVIRGSEIDPKVKYWIRPNIKNRIKEGSIHAYFNSQLMEIRPHEVDVQTPEGKMILENDFVLAMTGYQPDFNTLESLGVKIGTDDSGNRVPLYDEQTHETNVAGLFLAGTICGGMRTSKYFIENSRDHASKIMDRIQGKIMVV